MHSFSLEMLPQHLLCQFCAKVIYQRSGPDVVRPAFTLSTHRLRTSAASQEGSLRFYQCEDVADGRVNTRARLLSEVSVTGLQAHTEIQEIILAP